MAKRILEMKGIHKYFPGVHALNNCFFELNAGEVHALIGENGAGKSTLMKILSGVYTKDDGLILLDGKEINKPFVTDIINSLGLESKVDALPNTLSGGQQQRVAIARALVARPAIILADEPTGNLDSKTSDEVMSLLKTMIKKYNQTLVMITHDETIAQMADRVIYIEDGKVVKGGVTND